MLHQLTIRDGGRPAVQYLGIRVDDCLSLFDKLDAGFFGTFTAIGFPLATIEAAW